ncbi:hypothetical protein ACHAXM_000910 [Skeletonema potamos]|jgi:hypothetical protein
MEEQAAQGHEDASRIAAIDRLGLHIIDDAVVVPVPDEEIVPQDLESVDTYSGEDKQNPVITVDGSVIKSVNCYGREVSTSAIKWMVCALLIVIAIVVPTALTLSNQNEAVSRRPQPGLTDKEINELARQQRLSDILTPLSSKEDLENPNSPQSKALAWLLGPMHTFMDPDRNITMLQHGVPAKQVIEERYVMATLYYSLGGEEWTKQDYFLNAVPTRKWSSDLLQADEKGLITGIFLGENNLQGVIPPEIQYLQRLQHFHIQKNFVNGTVPVQMKQMTSLTGLWAHETNLTGSIDFFCDIGRSNATDECESCGFKVDLGNVECSCCECCA